MTIQPPRDVSGFQRQVVLVDLEARTVAPLKGLQSSMQYGHLTPLDVRSGPLRVVSGTGSCLNVREGVGLAAEIITCYPDGAILGYAQDSAEADDIMWSKVALADGTVGWASTEYLVGLGESDTPGSQADEAGATRP